MIFCFKKVSMNLNQPKSERSTGIQSGLLLTVLLVLVYVIAVLTRLEFGRPYRGNFFTSESALRLHYGTMISEGDSLPEVDYKAQYPEGLELSGRNPVLMEYVTGYSYRLLGIRMPFADFVRLFIPVVSSLSVLAVYLVAAGASGNRSAGLISALFFAVALPAVSRACGWEFLHEALALPFIFFHIYFFLEGIRKNKPYFGLLSGIFVALALAGWKISQLYFLLLSVFVALDFLFGKTRPPAGGIFSLTIIPVLLSGLLVPFLRRGLFLTSYSMAISYSVCAAALFRRFGPKGGAKSRLLFFILLIALLLIFPRSERFSHTYGLMIYKLRFLGEKPPDPTLLPFEVRALWADPLTSPSLFELIYHFFPLALLGGVSVVMISSRWLKKNTSTADLFIAYNTVLFFLAYLLVRRLRVPAAFFLTVSVAYPVTALLRSPKKYLRSGLIIILLFLGLEWARTSVHGKNDIFTGRVSGLGLREKAQYFRMRTFSDTLRDLIEWIEENTGEDEVILTHYHLSPQIRAYTGRAVNLTSLFESKPLRRKVEEFIRSLYGDEEKLYDFCRTQQADYVIYSIDSVIDDSHSSWRYLGGFPRLDENTAAYKMHFFPEKLTRFELVYENEFYRVYEVAGKGKEVMGGVPSVDHPMVYRFDLFRRFSGSTSRFKNFVEGIYSLYLKGSRRLSRGDYEEARDFYEDVLNMVPDFPEPYAGLGAVYENTGDLRSARRYYEEYLRLSPRGAFSGEIRKRIQALNPRE